MAKERLRIWKESWTPTPPAPPAAATTGCGQPTARCCYWGVTHARNTFIHSVEEVLNVPNRLTDKPMQMTVVDEAGVQHTVYMRRHYNAQQPHISEDFVKLEQAYLDCGAARNTKFGDASCILCDAEGLFRVTRHVLAPNPEAFVTERVIPPERWEGLCTGKTGG